MQTTEVVLHGKLVRDMKNLAVFLKMKAIFHSRHEELLTHQYSNISTEGGGG
jgi:hypothetical protein